MAAGLRTQIGLSRKVRLIELGAISGLKLRCARGEKMEWRVYQPTSGMTVISGGCACTSGYGVLYAVRTVPYRTVPYRTILYNAVLYCIVILCADYSLVLRRHSACASNA